MNQDTRKEIYVSTGELMETLSISRSTVYRLMAKGLPNIRVGSVHRFPFDQVVAWLRADKAGSILKKQP
jgi:excisionase family DNA binding protein